MHTHMPACIYIYIIYLHIHISHKYVYLCVVLHMFLPSLSPTAETISPEPKIPRPCSPLIVGWRAGGSF